MHVGVRGGTRGLQYSEERRNPALQVPGATVHTTHYRLSAKATRVPTPAHGPSACFCEPMEPYLPRPPSLEGG